MSIENININTPTCDEVLDRFKIATNQSQDTKIAILLGAGKTNVSAWRKRNTIPYYNLYWACRKESINLDWVITGKGSPKKDYPSLSEESAGYQVDSEFISIPFYEVDISAGNGSNPVDEEEFKPLVFRREFFDDMGLNPDDLIGGNVPGDSMQPLIPANSGILIDKTDQKMTDGKIYVFNADGNLLVKKIIVSFDGFIAHSLNEEYKDIEISKDKVDSLIIVGRARLALPYIKL